MRSLGAGIRGNRGVLDSDWMYFLSTQEDLISHWPSESARECARRIMRGAFQRYLYMSSQTGPTAYGDRIKGERSKMQAIEAVRLRIFNECFPNRNKRDREETEAHGSRKQRAPKRRRAAA